MRRARPLLLTLCLSACLDPFALDDAVNQSSASGESSSSSSSGGGATSEDGETGTGTTEVAGASTAGEVGSSGESGPLIDGVGVPVWQWLFTAPGSPVMERGPLTIGAHATFAETIELRLDGVSLGEFADSENVQVLREVPIVYDGQDGEHVLEGVARSAAGEVTKQTVVTIDLPPGGQDVVTPWLGQHLGTVDAAFALARDGEQVFTLGVRDTGIGWIPLLRVYDADNEYQMGWRLIDWTENGLLPPARAADFGMGMVSRDEGGVFLAMNLVVNDVEEPRGYVAGLIQEGEDMVPVFPEVLLEQGETIEEIAEYNGRLVAVGRKTVPGGRTVAMAWGFNSVTGESAWAPVQVEVPNWNANEEPRSARFNGVTFTNDGNVLAVGSTQVLNDPQESKTQTRALLLRLGPDGLKFGEPEVFGDQHFFVQTEALAVSPFDSPDGYCWTGWTRNGDFDPEMMVVDCRGETLMSWFSSEWTNSAGLTIAYTPLTRRAIVGGYRNGLHDAVAIAVEGTGVPFESRLGWTYAYASPLGGLDRVTALVCQTYECDVLIASDMLGKPQVRVSRVNQ